MTADLYLVTGIILALLAIPSVFSAIMDGHPPRVATLVLMAAGVLIILAIKERPGGYTLEDVPNAFVRVVAQVIR